MRFVAVKDSDTQTRKSETGGARNERFSRGVEESDTLDDGTNVFDRTLSDPHADPRSIGRILVESGKLREPDAERIAELQKREGIFFGEAARQLKLVKDSDIQYALAQQFNYAYLKISEGIFSKEIVAAYRPFSEQAESLRAIRSQLVTNWLGNGHKVLAIVSAGGKDGRSYLAANLAILFAQLNIRTLLVDADLRRPRQHEIFQFSNRVGLSAMLAGRVRKHDLERLPEVVPFFTNLSVLGAGSIPPNPLELLAGDRMSRILNELSNFYDVLLVDTPAAKAQVDYQPIAAAAGSALLLTRKSATRLTDAKRLLASMRNGNVDVVGSVLNNH